MTKTKRCKTFCGMVIGPIAAHMVMRGQTHIGPCLCLIADCARAGIKTTEAYGRTYVPSWAWAVWRLSPGRERVRRLRATRRGGTAAKRAALAEYALATQAGQDDRP